MNRTLRAATLASVMMLIASFSNAQFFEVAALVERKKKQLELAAEQAQQTLKKGKEAFSSKDYESAFLWYKSALDSLPSAGSATVRMRVAALQGLAHASVALARQRISEGRFQEAQSFLAVVLQERYCPNYRPALALQQQLTGNRGLNTTVTSGFGAGREKVKQLLREAKGFCDSGRYDLAFKRYEQVLNIDKYNIAARRGQEEVDKARLQYAEEAYHESRSSMIAEVDQGWELPVSKFFADTSSIIEQPLLETRGTAAIQRKLDEILLPQVNFRDTILRDALQYVRQRAAALDSTESEPSRKGINIILKVAPGSDQGNTPITLQLSDIPLRSVLTYLTEGAHMKLKVEPYAVLLVPLSESTDVLITKEYRVPSSFISQLPGSNSSAPLRSFPGEGGQTLALGSQPAIATRSGAKEFLEEQGVTFPSGASANYLPSSSCLIVKNTRENLDLVDSLVEQSISSPQKQVNIEAKFVEITQNNAQELGFDWLLGQFQLPFGSGVSGRGGGNPNPSETTGTNTPRARNFPIQDASGVPVGALENGSGALTGGNRSGGLAIQANVMDALLLGGSGGAVITPGVLALAGVFTNPQFQVVIRALNQKRGVDLMTAPSITAKSGHAAKIQIVREFRYPTQFDPPQVPPTQTFGISPITPSTPSVFDTKNVGIELKVTPTVGPDGNTIDLILQPKVTEFEGFINYGSRIDTVAPITSALGLATGATANVKLSDNIIQQPVFSIREASTQVTIADGSTVVLGGLIQEKVQKVQDKTPILGDIPWVGRLFRATAEQHVKTNLMIFVTAKLIDPGGQFPVTNAADSEALSSLDLPMEQMGMPVLSDSSRPSNLLQPFTEPQFSKGVFH